jgi:type VII secretion-associated serine protease mycosin
MRWIVRRRAALLGVLTALASALMVVPASAASVVEVQPPDAACTYNNTRDVQQFPKSALPDIPWPQEYLGYQQAQQYSTGQGIVVAVIDSGIEGDSEQLRGRVYSGFDLTGPTAKVGANTDCFAHGTAVAGIIGAAPHTGVGFVGVAPGALLLPIRQTWGINANGDPVVGDATKLVAGIYTAVNNGAQVINISITVNSVQLSPQLRAAFEQAARYAWSHNVVIVAATGNSSENRDRQVVDTYPAALAGRYPNVIAVGGIGRDGTLYKESVYGTTPWVTVVAPADTVISTFIDKGLRRSMLTTASGTSFATPFVTGTVALLQARYRGITAAEVKRRIELTADHPSTNLPDIRTGYGLIDPLAALTTIIPAAGPAPSPRVSAPLPPPANPGHTTRNTAIAAAGLAGVLSALLVGAAVVIPRGRGRNWQPGHRAPVEP